MTVLSRYLADLAEPDGGEGNAFDELANPDGSARAGWSALLEQLNALEPTDLVRTQREVARLLEDDNVTYTPSPASRNPSRPGVPSRCIWDDPALSPKIRDACAVARADGYRYLWIDSCCIDKTSSAELSEAINSMYRWYAHAALCYAFLADVPPKADPALPGSRFRRSRWFTRGWTLQELVAPLRVVFLARDWRPIGSKHALAALVADVTGIAYNALLHVEPLESASVAQRLSWACGRQYKCCAIW